MLEFFFTQTKKKVGEFFFHHDIVYNNLMWQTQKSEKNMIQVLIYAEIQATTEWNGNRYKKSDDANKNKAKRRWKARRIWNK